MKSTFADNLTVKEITDLVSDCAKILGFNFVPRALPNAVACDITKDGSTAVLVIGTRECEQIIKSGKGVLELVEARYKNAIRTLQPNKLTIL